MAQVITYGVKKIEFGVLASDGGPATSVEALGLSKEGTVSFTEEDPEVTEFRAEEVDDPVFVAKVRGKRSLKLTLVSTDTATLKKVFGGEVSSGAGAKTWTAPDSLVTIEQTVKITTRNGTIMTINRGNLTAKFTGDLTKKDMFGIEVTVELLTPTKDGVKAFTVTDPTA